ncbi:MAG: GtrA family protein [archaeon]|nr:GtrA family protein [archaeon]
MPRYSSSGKEKTSRERFLELDERYGIFRAAKFGVAGAIGFVVAEVIIVIGLYALYGKANVPSAIYSSHVLLALNIVAFVIGVTVGFFVNERITVRNQGEQKIGGARNVAIRLLKFQGVYAIGNAITIGVQLALLEALSLSPAIGNVIGAIVAFPVSYFVSMRVVWRLVSMGQGSQNSAEDSRKKPSEF